MCQQWGSTIVNGASTYNGDTASHPSGATFIWKQLVPSISSGSLAEPCLTTHANPLNLGTGDDLYRQ